GEGNYGAALFLSERKRKTVMVLTQNLDSYLITVIGHTGESLNIRCTYESGYESNPKYLCKGVCNIGNKVIMVKSGSPAEDQRFSLSDNTTARVFTVTITDLRTEDTGQYWCGIICILNENHTTETNPQSSSITITDQNKSTGQFIWLSLYMTLIS
uniref:Immunoglobulin V-set domain-containing protein n=1 Tax=Cyprinus carpio TaxID=7962 RepID=A0A8C1R0D2_CYPCA